MLLREYKQGRIKLHNGSSNVFIMRQDTPPDFGTMARHPAQEMQFDPVWQGGSVDLPDSLLIVTMPPPTPVTAPWIRGSHPFW